MRTVNKIFLYVAGYIVFSFLFALFAFAQSWSSLNGPRVASNVKDITLTSSTLYAVDNDILLKSTNSGAVWRGTVSQISNALVVVSRPDNANVVVVCGQNMAKRSTDGGSSWLDKSNLASNLEPLRLVASSPTPNQFYVGRKYHSSTKSVWYSTDGGYTWDVATNFEWNTDVTDISPYPEVDNDREKIVWVGGSDPNNNPEDPTQSKTTTANTRGVWFSDDYGVTWYQSTLGNMNIKSVAVMPKAHPAQYHVYAANSSGKVNKTTNGGGSWTEVYSGSSIRMIRISSLNNYIYLATSNGVYLCVDSFS
jgi:hypothetical protein